MRKSLRGEPTIKKIANESEMHIESELHLENGETLEKIKSEESLLYNTEETTLENLVVLGEKPLNQMEEELMESFIDSEKMEVESTEDKRKNDTEQTEQAEQTEQTEQAASEFSEEDDPVLAKYPLFISEKLKDYLHLFQYPLKATQWTEDQDQRPSIARVKPNAQVVEVEIPINTAHSMYSKEQGKKFAVGLAGSGELLQAPPGKFFDMQTWTSTPVPFSSRFMVAAFQDGMFSKFSMLQYVLYKVILCTGPTASVNIYIFLPQDDKKKSQSSADILTWPIGELHLTPLNKISQLRYNLAYIDRINEKIKNSQKKASEKSEAPEKTTETQGVKTVQVRVRSSQTEEVLKRQENSITKIRQRIAEEPWSRLDYYDAESEECAAVHSQLFAAQKSPLYESNKAEYLSDMNLFNLTSS
ncbi:DNA-directed RNA polymerase III subunit RPC5 [Zancudomyces culisetae]|uniref:DNA-directed RNA polymerase III subunit RPC5 n=1 Tax=Zancudomyces culisetae TaxID=1213189 RepID=A0A1R1PZA1_ZANCU|nr:DNA-directed RNA polymerase III subunit RPC5 [Zancudomyces culisetae]|eukprot:OMH86290.1 DNA-directed RNA polymerase III subunit RPC5 [Zancudomyces culisetae]